MADAVITRLVRRGMVTNADLSAAGVSQDEIDWRVKRKRLIAVWRGVYLVGRPDPAPQAREYAALRFAGPGATLSDRPAAALWGLLPTQVDPTTTSPSKQSEPAPKA